MKIKNAVAGGAALAAGSLLIGLATRSAKRLNGESLGGDAVRRSVHVLTIARDPQDVEAALLQSGAFEQSEVDLAPAPGGRGTEVTLDLDPDSRRGTESGAALRRLKSILEAGDVALNGSTASA